MNNNIVGAKFSKRLLAFIVDMLLIGILMQLLMVLLKTPYENAFHLEKLRTEYYQLGINMGVFDSSHNVISGISTALQEEFLKASKPTVDAYNQANMIVNMINGLISGTIFLFLVPLGFGEGRTVGKLVTKLRVVKKDGSKLDFLSLLLRNFVGLTLIEFVISIPVMFLPFTISACLVLAGNSKRALHDYIGGTVCVYAEGFEPKVKELNNSPAINPFHKQTKGFEYIDIEALEKRDREGMNAQQKVEPVKENKAKPIDVIDMDALEQREKEAKERMSKARE